MGPEDAFANATESGKVDAVSAARAFIADPFLYRNTVGMPHEVIAVCGYCNVCIATFSTTRIDSGSSRIRARRDAMIAHALGAT